MIFNLRGRLAAMDDLVHELISELRALRSENEDLRLMVTRLEARTNRLDPAGAEPSEPYADGHASLVDAAREDRSLMIEIAQGRRDVPNPEGQTAAAQARMSLQESDGWIVQDLLSKGLSAEKAIATLATMRAHPAVVTPDDDQGKIVHPSRAPGALGVGSRMDG